MDPADTTALWIASQHTTYNPLIDYQIRAAGMTPAEFFRRLDRLAYDAAAEEYDSATVRRVREAHSRNTEGTKPEA
ncbi:hypothetical protein GCM10023159_25780 [Brevibacterium yomogidense]